MSNRKGFTLIELLVVIAILAVVVILTLNPIELLRQSRDANRVNDMSVLTEALALYSQDVGGSMGTANIIYISIPDATATSTAGDQCQGLGLPAAPATYTYHCASTSTFRNIDGTGWVPINFKNMTGTTAPISNLSVDPTNVSSSRLYYTYATNGTQYEVSAAMESAKYKMGGTNDVVSGDGGQLASLYEKGTLFGLQPLDTGDSSLVGYWSFNEGTGSSSYDYSGGNNTLTWTGTQAGTAGYFSAGKVKPYAAVFDGGTDKASHAHISAFDFGTGDFSVAFWIDPQGTWSGTTQGIIGQKTNDSSPGWQVYHDSGDSTQIRFRLGDILGDGSDTQSSIGSVPVNQWTFVVAERQSLKTAIYINGVLNASTTNAKNISGGSAAFNIGYADTWTAYYQGLLDDVRVYNRALSSVEIAGLYSGQK